MYSMPNCIILTSIIDVDSELKKVHLKKLVDF